MSPVRILLADDHDMVRNGLRYILQRQDRTEVIVEARDGREAVRMAEELPRKAAGSRIALVQE